ncbi:MAG: hypothetical protein QG574_874 [Cyanobacteriota bacterium erpe_2018_sw_21hr_WHONDRS-SW48-000092_B_bin.40]|nr:hypothetical protein [Cyanobacteriota bacterium erpe_2018_sw_21hr_WHONDRS-SW48-000092_B_bin.40]
MSEEAEQENVEKTEEAKKEPKSQDSPRETPSEAAPSELVTEASPTVSASSTVSAPGSPTVSSSAHEPGKLSIFDLAAGVLLLAFVSLFAVNIFIANLAYDYNERMCHTAIVLAGKAASDGKDSLAVKQAANGFMDKCGPGGFFVERPELITFYDEINPDLRQVSVATSTRVLIPAPFIVADKSRFDRDGMHMTFKSVCQFQLKNPKNCDSGKVKINPTGKTFEIKMLNTPVVAPKPAVKKEDGKAPSSPEKKGPKPVSSPGAG